MRIASAETEAESTIVSAQNDEPQVTTLFQPMTLKLASNGAENPPYNTKS